MCARKSASALRAGGKAIRMHDRKVVVIYDGD
jgi:hypothetical protein